MHQQQPIVLAIDHGTSGIKAALMTVHGKPLAFEYEKTTLVHTADGGVEQDPEEWWRALVQAVKRLRENHRELKISAVCVSSMFSSMLPVDREGRHLMNCMLWLDNRGAPYVREKLGGPITVEGYGVDKLLRWIPVTGGGPTFSGKDDISHALYVRHARPEIYDKTFKFLPAKDYLNARLTGEICSTAEAMTLFWVTDNRDTRNIRYHDSLLRTFGIDRDKMPELRRSSDKIGEITAAAAAELGLERGIPIFGGSPDLHAACLGSGAVRDYEGHLYVGTSSWIICHLPFKKTDLFHSIATIPSAIPGKYICANEQDMAAGALDFVIHRLLFPAGGLGTADRENIYQHVENAVMRSAPGSRGLIFAPWLNGEKSPAEDHNLRAVFYNMSLQTTQDDLIRSVHEGVAFNTRWLLHHVNHFTKRKMETLNFIGGGAQSAAWCQIFADVLGVSMKRVKDPRQANARGAAYLAGIGLGELTLDDIPALTEIDRVFEPDRANGPIYDLLFENFLKIYERNKSIFQSLQTGLQKI